MEKKVIVLMCGGRRCCPQVTFNEDGSVDVIDTDDGKNERRTASRVLV
jgi:hypothetical protein